MSFTNNGNEQEVCACGRPFFKNKPHCPGCGRSACYAKPSKAFNVDTQNKGPVRVMVYQCRGCGIEFNSLEMVNCEAPPLGMSMKQRRQADKIMDGVAEMSLDDRKKLAYDMLRKYQGTTTPTPSDSNSKVTVTKPFEIGDDRQMIEQAISDSGATFSEIQDAKASVSLDKEDGETQICEEKP